MIFFTYFQSNNEMESLFVSFPGKIHKESKSYKKKTHVLLVKCMRKVVEALVCYLLRADGSEVFFKTRSVEKPLTDFTTCQMIPKKTSCFYMMFF